MISCPPKTAVICPRPSTDRQDGKPQTAMTQDYLLVPPGKAMARLALPAGSPTSHARIHEKKQKSMQKMQTHEIFVMMQKRKKYPR